MTWLIAFFLTCDLGSSCVSLFFLFCTFLIAVTLSCFKLPAVFHSAYSSLRARTRVNIINTGIRSLYDQSLPCTCNVLIRSTMLAM
jgi:hypothetical protein